MKKVNNVPILNRLASKYKLAEYTQEPLLMSETIVPVTVIDDFVYTQSVQAAGAFSVSAAAAYTIYTVPTGKVATIKAGAIMKVTGTYDTVKFGVNIGGNTAYITPARTFDAQNLVYLLPADLPTPLQLFPGSTIFIEVSTYSVTGNATRFLLVEEQDYF